MSGLGRAALAWPVAALVIATSLWGCESRNEPPPPPPVQTQPELPENPVLTKQATSLLEESALRTHEWTPQQDQLFFRAVDRLPGKVRLSLVLRMINQINNKQMKRTIDPHEPDPVQCVSCCQGEGSNPKSPAPGTAAPRNGKGAH